MFNERKVAQIAAYFLHRRGGCMSHLKLMKLMYLADREAFNRFGRSITGRKCRYSEYSSTRERVRAVQNSFPSSSVCRMASNVV